MLRELREKTAAQHSGRERNQVAPEQGAFLGWLVQALGARRAIELGTFTGYSSLCLALVRLPISVCIWIRMLLASWHASGCTFSWHVCLCLEPIASSSCGVSQAKPGSHRSACNSSLDACMSSVEV